MSQPPHVEWRTPAARPETFRRNGRSMSQSAPRGPLDVGWANNVWTERRSSLRPPDQSPRGGNPRKLLRPTARWIAVSP